MPAPQVVLLIDTDNTSASRMRRILNLIKRSHAPSRSIAYGNFRKPHLRTWLTVMRWLCIEEVQVDDPVKGRSATDMRMAFEAGRMFESGVREFVLATSDADFAPVISTILEDGGVVHVYCTNTPARALVDTGAIVHPRR